MYPDQLQLYFFTITVIVMKGFDCVFYLYVQPVRFVLRSGSFLSPQVFIKLMRRYKYLEKMHEEEMNKILVYLKGFTEEERKRLAQVRKIHILSLH